MRPFGALLRSPLSRKPFGGTQKLVGNLIKSGVPEVVAMQITGHRSRETFRRYHIVDSSDIANAIKRVDGYVRREKEMGPTVG